MNDLVGLLRAAIAARSEGSVGVALSGGLDSSTVSVLAPRPLPAFTGWYDEPGFDERPWARLAARGFHHEVLITPEDFVEHFDGMARASRPPYMGMGAFGQYMVARHASNYVDALLSGEGSDELFGGYARHTIVAGEGRPEGYAQYRLPDGYPRDIAAALDHDMAMLPHLLAVDGQMCGAWGIEARAPFTDDRIVEYALSLPVRSRVGKRHLREAVAGLVPTEIIQRQSKMGFPIPLVAWAQREPVRSFVRRRLGYTPDPERPWDRAWWHELIATVTP